MRHLRQWKSSTGFFIVSLLFASFIITPNVLALSGYTWTNDSASTTNTATAGLDWNLITSNSTGQYLAAVANGGGIWTSTNYGSTWTSDNPTNITNLNWNSITSNSTGQYLAAVANSGGIYTANNLVVAPPTQPSTTTTVSTPDTGYGTPMNNNHNYLIIYGFSVVAVISIAGGVVLYYRRKHLVS